MSTPHTAPAAAAACGDRATPTAAEDIADLTLHHMGRTGVQPFVVVIGAMDGVTFDDFHGYISMYGWSGLFVEPIPEQFRRLRAYYATLSHAPQNRYENSAIAEHDGTVQMLTINQAAVDTGAVHPAFGGMSAIYPPRNGLASAGDAPVVAQYGELIEVECITLATLLRRHAVVQIDLLSIDAEGWDFRIIRQLDFTTYRPKLIRCEYINLTAEEQTAIAELLADHQYVIRIHGQNIDAVAAEYWQDVRASEPPPVQHRLASATGATTLVTALFDLSAGTSDLRLRHAFGRALDELKRLLTIDWPMVVFVQPELADLVWRFRRRANTHLVVRTIDHLEAFPFASAIRDLEHRAAPPRDPVPRLFYPFVLSKQFFLNDAAIYDPFGTDYFLWLDSDITAVIDAPAAQLTGACARALAGRMRAHAMLYVCRPLPAHPGVDSAAIAAVAQREPELAVDGRLFGGTRHAVNTLNGIYYGMLGDALRAGHLPTADTLLSAIAHAHRDLCTLEMLGPEESLRACFARWQRPVGDPAPDA